MDGRSRPPVQPDSPALENEMERLLRFFEDSHVVVLSGAGLSTESGIPDYRGLEGREHRRQPMRYQEFMGSVSARGRYWARSSAGWLRVTQARPNAGHRALASLEKSGWVRGVITQNVDGLHQAAGSKQVLELHGSLSKVRCMDCGRLVSRHALQRRLEELNPDVRASPHRFQPDGDADVVAKVEAEFQVPGCGDCLGILKPDVVFFGENVPRERVARCWEMYARADALLVLGSSLAVFSGRRFVLRAAEEGKPVAIVNLGSTRCDGLAALKVERRLGEVLPLLAKTVA